MRRRVEVRADVQRRGDLLAARPVEREPLDPLDRRAVVAGEGRRVHGEVLREIEHVHGGADYSSCFRQALDRGQPRVPLGGEARHPARRRVEPLGADRVADLAAAPPALDQAGAVEDREVLDHRHAADRQFAGQRRGGGLAALGEQGEHAPAGGIRQRREDLVAGCAHRQTATRSACSRRWPSSSPSPRCCPRRCSRAPPRGASSAAKPLSTTRSRVPSPSGASVNSTRVELPWRWLLAHCSRAPSGRRSADAARPRPPRRARCRARPSSAHARRPAAGRSRRRRRRTTCRDARPR